MKPITRLFAIALLSLANMTNAADFREVSFPTADGGTVYANRYGDGERAVVLAHGKVFNKESWHAQAQHLAAEGYQVLAIDFRGYGRSTAGSEGNALDEDVLAAVRYMHEQGSKSVSVIGGSMGGSAAARAATQAKPGEIDKLVLLSPVPIANPEAMRAHTLIYIASRDEGLTPRIRAQYQAAPEPKQIELLPGSAHAQHIFKTDQAEVLMQTILRYLD